MSNSGPRGFSDYNSDVHPGLLMDLFEQGLGKPSFCKEIGICGRTFDRWIDRHEDFKEAFDIGIEKQRAHYHERIVDAMDSKEANLPAILSAAKVIGGISGNKTFRLKGLDKNGDFKSHMQCLFDNIADGLLDKEEAKVFADILAVAVKVDENTTQVQRIDRLEAKAGIENVGS